MTAKRQLPKPGTSKESALARKRRFATAYIANRRNGTEAAKTAGFSARTAAAQATRLLKDVKVREMIAEMSERLAVKHDLTAESVIAELAKIVHADPRRLFDEGGNMIHPKLWPDDMAACVASLEVTEEFDGTGKDRKFIGYTKKLKLWDKNSAIEKAMKHLGLFAEDNKQRASALSELPREMVKAIVERLKQLNGQSPRLD